MEKPKEEDNSKPKTSLKDFFENLVVPFKWALIGMGAIITAIIGAYSTYNSQINELKDELRDLDNKIVEQKNAVENLDFSANSLNIQDCIELIKLLGLDKESDLLKSQVSTNPKGKK